MRNAWFYLKLYPYFVLQSIKARMSYRGDFILGVLASFLMQALGYMFIWIIFQNIPEIEGWNFYQITFIYGMSAITLGLNEFLFAGSWRVTSYIRNGNLDRLLLRPVHTLFSIMAADVTLHGIGAVFFGAIICYSSLIELKVICTVWMLLIWSVVILCGSLIYFAMNMLMATLAFWVIDSQSAMMLIQNISEFGKYPLNIFGSKIRFVLSFVIPYAFTSYYPSLFLLNISQNSLYWIGTIITTVICLLSTAFFWRFALKKYQSAGG